MNEDIASSGNVNAIGVRTIARRGDHKIKSLHVFAILKRHDTSLSLKIKSSHSSLPPRVFSRLSPSGGRRRVSGDRRALRLVLFLSSASLCPRRRLLLCFFLRLPDAAAVPLPVQIQSFLASRSVHGGGSTRGRCFCSFTVLFLRG